jgi:dolichol-phosphate mannosyltransferase
MKSAPRPKLAQLATRIRSTSKNPKPRKSRPDGRFTRLFRFVVVGATGLGVNELALWVAAGGFGIHYLAGAMVATQFSTAWNFVWTEHWVFRSGSRGRWKRFFWFSVVNNGWLLTRVPFLFVLTEWLGLHYLVSNLILLAASTIIRFAVADAIIWKEDATTEIDFEAPGVLARYLYDVHGIVRIESPVRLPELARFRTEALDGLADLKVGISNRGFGGIHRRTSVETSGQVTTYVEHLGSLGFAIKLDLGTPVRVQASCLLKWSPHVLYTNVVEPILRWMLVDRGYALAHAACLEINGKGVMITARTDTGKTTTCLKSIATHGSKFASDDMIILGPDGFARSYPKPLTISAHTMKAASAAPFVLWRKTLLQAQGRVHSKTGRRVGLHLGNYNLPLATLNAVVQMVVPPPKFFVEQLLPGTETVHSVPVQHMLVIERGTESMQKIGLDDACAILMGNTEDAYGFPPYPLISRALCNGHAPLEARLQRDFLARGIATTRIRTPDRDWYQRLPEITDASSQANAHETERSDPLPSRGGAC